jgi:hypothetical protein
MEKQRVQDLKQIQEDQKRERKEYKKEKKELMTAAAAVGTFNSEKEKGQAVEGRCWPHQHKRDKHQDLGTRRASSWP